MSESRDLERRRLGPGGPEVPVVGMGTWSTLDVSGPAAEAERHGIVAEALDAGTRLFDSSPERVVLPLAAELGLGVLVMRPLGRGRARPAVPGRHGPRAAAPVRRGDLGPGAPGVGALDPRVTAVIPATRRPGRPAENAAAGLPPWLGEEERALVARLAGAG